MKTTKGNPIWPAGRGLAIVGMFVASTAAYGKEEVIAETEGGKVTIETESVQRNGPTVEAGFWAYSGGERTAVVAKVEGCDQGEGRIKYEAFPANPGAKASIGRWTSTRRQVVDKMAAAACEQAESNSRPRR